MEMKQYVRDLIEAMESAGVPEEQRRQVLLNIVLIWGERLSRQLIDAEFAEMIAP